MQLRAAAERQAVNSVVQGSAADLVKKGMLLLDAELSAYKEGSARLVLQVSSVFWSWDFEVGTNFCF